MENSISANRIYYNHQSQEDKHYLGGYFNLAKNNIDQAIEALKIKYQPSKENNTSLILKNVFKLDIAYAQWEAQVNFLKLYFPVVHYLDLPVTHNRFSNFNDSEKEDSKRKYFLEMLLCLLKTIEDLRNYYTHYYHSPLSIDPKIYPFLDEVFLNTCLTVRKKRMKSDKTRELLKKELTKEVNILIKLKLADLKRRKAEGEKVSLNPDDIYSSVLNESFNYLLYKENKVYKVKDIHISQCNTPSVNGQNLSRSGLVFLISMFLTKKQGEDFRSRIHGYKEKIRKKEEIEISPMNNSLRFMATHWVYSNLSYKGLKTKLNTTFSKEALQNNGVEHKLNKSFTKEALLIQIADELSKVPDEVYQVLSEERRKEFLEDVNGYITERKEIESLNDSIVVHPVIRKRYDNKFAYLALRYLDEFANFKSLRFQIHFGNYVHDSRTKDIEGTKLKTDRQIKERINVFGKLSEVTRLKTEFFVSTEVDRNSWKIFPNPSYCIIDNNIPITFLIKGKANKISSRIAQIKEKRNDLEKRKIRSNGKPNKEEILKIISEGSNSEIKTGEPMALLSINELPALLYELLHNGKSTDDIEKVIIEKYVEQFETIDRFQPKSEEVNSRIPQKLKGAIDIDQLDYEKLLKTIDKDLKETDEKRELIKDCLAEAQKKQCPVFSLKIQGQEAIWLADDIIRFMPTKSRENWKGRHQSHLQYTLAFYDLRKEEAFSLLESFWKMNEGPYWGQSIKDLFNQSKFEDFYWAYLNMRNEVLSGLHNSISNFKGQPSVMKKVHKEVDILFNKRQYIIRSIDKQKTLLLSKPVAFPRGIFDPKPTFIKDKKVEDSPNDFADWYRYSYKGTHQFQSFYSLERSYIDLSKRELDNDPDFKKNKKGLTEEAQLNLLKMKQDLKIKKVKTQDLFLKLIADKLFQDIFDNNANLTLKDFYQTQKERKEIRSKALLQSQRNNGDKSDNIVNENFIWNKTVPYSEGQLYEPSVKLKEIGKFKRFLNDERVKKLFSYAPERVWNKQELEDEMELKSSSYEVIRREKLLKEIQNLEKHILDQEGFDGQNHPTNFEEKNCPNFKKYIINGIIKKQQLAPADEIDWFLNEKFEGIKADAIKGKSSNLVKAYILILIRNKFAHNQFPDKESLNLMLDLCSKSTVQSYSEYFLKVTQNIIDEFGIIRN
ncbi:MAG: type VI-B CRISPR-associated RNA-guided ribonuclease Cas13b [Sporocytophaga sp.]|uniref:type VI-B CRISPR-associated RNA-guided ribonuclease Cas13b n=1 Tax=Sporocytophaga sp. TaxID=2231183 RepID=UPI001B1376AE|nr:type VI-B CRISPR-associated RNA-guided ribonuclease Cas13b [Sporocytophaga sp.]MBO9700363.1 type VI-B CRISPR-associated RNA-guided ribonuclease Cas13b [Sporocytophaga sp.]